MRATLPLLLLLTALAPAADAPTFPTSEDLRHFRSLSSPQLSPDGQNVLLAISDSTSDGAKSHLWLVNIAQNTSRQLTYTPEADKSGEHAAVWTPDGNAILFLAHRGEHTQLFRLSMNGGEAKPYDLKILPPVDDSTLPDAIPPATAKDAAKSETEKPEPQPIDVQAFEASPDGKTIALTANDPKTPGEKKQSDAKADATWVDHSRHHTRLYLLPSDTTNLTPVSIPDEPRHLTWKLDSSKLLVLGAQPNGLDDLKPGATAWLVNPSDPAHPEKISELPPTISSAAWSYDGNSIAFLAQAHQDAPPAVHDLYELNLTTHKIVNLTDGFKGAITSTELFTLPDSSILVSVGLGLDNTCLQLHNGAREPFHFSLPVSSSFHTNANHNGYVFLASSSTQPTTLFYTTDLTQPAKALNTPSITPSNNRAVATKRIQWKNDGFTLDGLLSLPPEAANHKVPLILEVHGGPTGAYTDAYQPFVNFLIGHGWAVLRTNPRGSTNYGAAFAAANKNDLGGGDYRDIMSALDYLLKTEPIDPARLALEGYSYGGEMAGFVEGKTSRFKAIISGAPVIDQYSEYGTESDSYYDRWFYGKPWEHPQDAWRQSPLSGVAHATTPFLLLQGEGDTTDPVGQAQEMYRALRQMGVPVDLVTYPRDNHGPLGRGIYGAPINEPWHGFDARQRIVQGWREALRQFAIRWPERMQLAATA